MVSGYTLTPGSAAVYPHAWYVRAPVNGSLAAHALVPTVPEDHLSGSTVTIHWPQVAVVDERVMLFFGGSGATYLAESTDGGRTWGPSVRLEGPLRAHHLSLAPTPTVGILPDGRPIFAAQASDARSKGRLATVLPYDPLPDPTQGLVRAADPDAPLAGPLVTFSGESSGLVPRASHVGLRVYLTNPGEQEVRGDMVFRGVPPGLRALGGRIVLGPGETLPGGISFDDPGGALPANAEVEVVLREDGRDVSLPYRIRVLVTGSDAPAAATPATPPPSIPPSRPPPTMPTPLWPTPATPSPTPFPTEGERPPAISTPAPTPGIGPLAALAMIALAALATRRGRA